MPRTNKFIKFVNSMLLVLFICLTACSSTNKGNTVPVKLDSLRGAPPPGMKQIEKIVDRKAYSKLIQTEGDLNSARLVEVFNRNKEGAGPQEFRILDVQRGSAYEFIGLQNADVIVATDGYVVPDQSMFWNYMLLIQSFEEAKIELRRDNNPTMLRVIFKGKLEEE